MTELGRILAVIPVAPRYAKLLLLSRFSLQFVNEIKGKGIFYGMDYCWSHI